MPLRGKIRLVTLALIFPLITSPLWAMESPSRAPTPPLLPHPSRNLLQEEELSRALLKNGQKQAENGILYMRIAQVISLKKAHTRLIHHPHVLEREAAFKLRHDQSQVKIKSLQTRLNELERDRAHLITQLQEKGFSPDLPSEPSPQGQPFPDLPSDTSPHLRPFPDLPPAPSWFPRGPGAPWPIGQPSPNLPPAPSSEGDVAPPPEGNVTPPQAPGPTEDDELMRHLLELLDNSGQSQMPQIQQLLQTIANQSTPQSPGGPQQGLSPSPAGKGRGKGQIIPNWVFGGAAAAAPLPQQGSSPSLPVTGRIVPPNHTSVRTGGTTAGAPFTYNVNLPAPHQLPQSSSAGKGPSPSHGKGSSPLNMMMASYGKGSYPLNMMMASLGGYQNQMMASLRAYQNQNSRRRAEGPFPLSLSSYLRACAAAPSSSPPHPGQAYHGGFYHGENYVERPNLGGSSNRFHVERANLGGSYMSETHHGALGDPQGGQIYYSSGGFTGGRSHRGRGGPRTRIFWSHGSN